MSNKSIPEAVRITSTRIIKLSPYHARSKDSKVPLFVMVYETRTELIKLKMKMKAIRQTLPFRIEIETSLLLLLGSLAYGKEEKDQLEEPSPNSRKRLPLFQPTQDGKAFLTAEATTT